MNWSSVVVFAMGASLSQAETWSSVSGANSQSNQEGPASAVSNRGLSPAASQLLFSEIEMLKQEIQGLRATIEEQGYELNKLKTEQKERYLDLDRRVSQVVQNGGASTTSEPSSQSSNAQDSYDAAFSLMKARKLPEAALGFQSFLSDFPKSALAVNGYYWLGQIHYNQGDLDEARKAFTIVVNQYPEHQKSPDSTYKLGVILHRLGDTTKSKSLLQSVVRQYPDSASARFASKYLKENMR